MDDKQHHPLPQAVLHPPPPFAPYTVTAVPSTAGGGGGAEEPLTPGSPSLDLRKTVRILGCPQVVALHRISLSLSN